MFHSLSWRWLATTFVNIIVYAGIMQGLFLAFVLTTRKNKSRKSNRMLAVLLVVLSLSIFHDVVAQRVFGGMYRLKEPPLILLIGPLLLFYVRESIGGESAGAKDFLHFVPFLVLLAAATPEWMLKPSSAYPQFLSRNAAAVSIGVWIVIIGQYAFYWLKTVRLIYSNVNALESEYSTIEGKTLSWLEKFMHVFGILQILIAATVLIGVRTGHYAEVDTIVSLWLSCVVFALGYEGLFQEEIFSNAAGRTLQPQKLEVNREAESRLYMRLTAYIEEKKPYLDEKLTLTKLAADLGATRNQLSSAINNRSGSNFFTFINGYRVDEVKRLISDPKNREFTILSLAFQAGFASKSTFHEMFKKIAGMTPTEYQGKVRK